MIYNIAHHIFPKSLNSLVVNRSACQVGIGVSAKFFQHQSRNADFLHPVVWPNPSWPEEFFYWAWKEIHYCFCFVIVIALQIDNKTGTPCMTIRHLMSLWWLSMCLLNGKEYYFIWFHPFTVLCVSYITRRYSIAGLYLYPFWVSEDALVVKLVSTGKEKTEKAKSVLVSLSS